MLLTNLFEQNEPFRFKTGALQTHLNATMSTFIVYQKIDLLMPVVSFEEPGRQSMA
ncbi:MAG: hypothetical protein GX115_04410 [Ruminiclostridium sp.]|nr:hypothetical protein [Ruminiclostridium sp.]